MQIDPAAEWMRLTQVYGEMGDIELRELDADRENLTEVAQQVLRDEIRKRRLTPATDGASRFAFDPTTPPADHDDLADADDRENGESPEFTWKVELCECADRLQAAQLSAVLRQAGVDCWINTPYSPFGGACPRLLVAADQLEQAQTLASRPIPQAVVDELNAEPEEYQPPRCPECGAEDPVLEGNDPTNQWLCDACGTEWADPAEDPGEPAAQAQ